MRGRSWLVLGLVVVLVGVGAAAYARSGGNDADHYRTATAVRGTVEQTLTASGTVDAAHRADVDLEVAGTVRSVAVRQGARVRAGAVLARLDSTSLRADVAASVATLAKARAQLVSDENAQSATVSSSAGGSGGTGSGDSAGGTRAGGAAPSSGGQQGSGQQGSGQQGGTHPGGAAGTGTPTKAVRDALKALRSEQAAVTSAQSAATRALAEAKAALQAQTTACGTAFQGGTATATPTPGADGSDSSADPGDSTAADQACQAALSLVQTEQQAVDAAQRALADALATLSGTLNGAVALLEKASATSSGTTRTSAAVSTHAAAATLTAASLTPVSARQTPSTDGSTADSTGGSTGGSSGGSSGGRTVTAATLAKDQAGIDADRADLYAARQALSKAVVTTPIAGRVVALDLAKGDTVAAGDTAAVVTRGRGLLVDASIPETRIRSVEVGQRVRLTTPGSTTVSHGTVASIGLTPDTTVGTASYPVTIAVPDPATALPSGSAVVLQVVLHTVANVVTVPTSAVTRLGTRSLVRTLKDGRPTPTRVTLGSVGGSRTQVRTGLTPGTRVVLADLDQQVTGASTTLRNRSGFAGPGGAGNGGPPGRGGPPS